MFVGPEKYDRPLGKWALNQSPGPVERAAGETARNQEEVEDGPGGPSSKPSGRDSEPAVSELFSCQQVTQNF